MKTLTAEQLAELLHVSHATINKRVCVDPNSLPPFMKIPGQKKPLWVVEDVEAWMRSHVNA